MSPMLPASIRTTREQYDPRARARDGVRVVQVQGLRGIDLVPVEQCFVATVAMLSWEKSFHGGVICRPS
jgi:hypothetical protein